MPLELNDITYRYPAAEWDVFTHLSLTMAEPGFNALFGPSGVGKTSLAKIITGTITDFSGTLSITGLSHLLYSYNLERLPGWSSIGDHLRKNISPARLALSGEIISVFGLDEYMDSRYPQLSLGQKNRINLARYLLQDFDLLIMDESLANVDEPTRERIILAMKSMFPDKYFLYISHNALEVARYCREIFILREGGKTPQSTLVRGLDFGAEQQPGGKELDNVVLEIMNAA